MPQSWADLATEPQVIAVVACSVAAAAFGGIAYARHVRNRPSANELERRRRQAVNSAGKICDGEIVEVTGERKGEITGQATGLSIIYTYSVAGVEYTAAQEVGEFEARLPDDAMSMIGPVTLKYDPRNPANSIVISEKWSGLRKPRAQFPMAQ
jgi:hypothetical protein